MAFNSRIYPQRPLIHHSDRGIQYCCNAYVELLQKYRLHISMTQSGSPYENAMAERVNGILKHDFKLNRVFKNHMEALLATDTAIKNYNNLRPHMSCNYMTPSHAHELDIPIMKKHW